MRRKGEWLGSAKSQMGWGFLVGLVRECTTGLSSRWPTLHGQNRPRPGKPRLYRKKADFKRKPEGGFRERERQRRNTDNIIYRGHRIRRKQDSRTFWIITIIIGLDI